MLSQTKISPDRHREALGDPHPFGCCRTVANSSTAVAEAMAARPGRVTVHI